MAAKIVGWVCIVIGVAGGFAQGNLPAAFFWTALGLLILYLARRSGSSRESGTAGS
jgi:hypothetical protein